MIAMQRERPLYIPREECGVFGVFGHPDAAQLTYFGLYALQHRGQESAGIVTAWPGGGAFRRHRGMGLVSQVFDEKILKSLDGDRAIGHVRYSTTGSSNLRNAQPLVADTARGQVAIAHNGNLVNAIALRRELEAQGSIFHSTTDSEIILHLIARGVSEKGESILSNALNRLLGAYSLLILSEEELVAIRDPHGFRPLCYGRLGSAHIFSSETCALDLIGATFVRELEPGEVVCVSDAGFRVVEELCRPKRASLCIFEHVYFARPDSVLCGKAVCEVRKEMGRRLARLHPVEADIVVPVPDSGNYAAQGFSEESGIPLEYAFVRNHYVGRTFIQPSQLTRDLNVRVKLNLIRSLVYGKRVVVVDDSIVRGTTAKARVVNLREAGAKEVHVRISCPPHRFACYYGIDFPDPKKLIANQMPLDQIAKFLGADSLGYLDVDGMTEAVGGGCSKYCTACFTGDYPEPYDFVQDKLILEQRRNKSQSLLPATDQRVLKL